MTNGAINQIVPYQIIDCKVKSILIKTNGEDFILEVPEFQYSNEKMNAINNLLKEATVGVGFVDLIKELNDMRKKNEELTLIICSNEKVIERLNKTIEDLEKDNNAKKAQIDEQRERLKKLVNTYKCEKCGFSYIYSPPPNLVYEKLDLHKEG